MELRNHPVMICDGVRTWPPKWLQTYGPICWPVEGEVGTLDSVFLSRVIPPDRVHLVIRTAEGNGYLGSFIFENPKAAKKIFDLLFGYLKEPISVIGAIDLPLDL